jgi:hypothetical protein
VRHRVAWRVRAVAATTPVVGLDNQAAQHRTVLFDAFAGKLEAEIVHTSEGGQIRAGEGSVMHIEVFQMSGVGTFILGRPGPSPGQWHADR